MTFLARRPVYFLMVAVLFTTIFSWFRINTWCIIPLLAYRLWMDGPANTVRRAFTNKLFLAYFIYCLIEAAGLFYTHNPAAGANLVAKDATLTAMAFIFCAGPFADARGYKKLITAYNLLVFAASVYCLAVALTHYLHVKDRGLFFYHDLTAPISQNAVFYSVYVLFAMQFLLSPEGSLEITFLSAGLKKGLRIFLVAFFLLMIVLLSSKLILVIALLMLVNFFIKNIYSVRNRRTLVVAVLAASSLVAVLVVTDNPVRKRFEVMANGEIRAPKRSEINILTPFNALQLRLLEWEFAVEILKEHHAWIFGVSPGDSQDLLDQKYIDNHMYIGNPAEGPHRKVRGYIGYNFHNQYVQTLVHSGIIGLASLLAILALLVGIALRWKTREARFTVLTLIIFFIPEAPLTMQHGVFLFVFFPLLLLYSPPKGPAPGAYISASQL
jgi:O-antigen ligase